jgi:hypothetical protein
VIGFYWRFIADSSLHDLMNLFIERETRRGKKRGGKEERAPMALGDKVGETSGRVTGTRVITPSGTQQVRLEVSIQGSGKVLGEDVTEIGTYVQILRPGGVLYGEGDVLYIRGNDETVHWKGFGVGRPTGPFPAGHFAVCGSSETESHALRRLNKIAIVTEFDVGQKGDYHATGWEWR